jgi:hypothetical protein
LNGKLLDMARLSLQRHHAQIDDAAALSALIDELRTRYAAAQALPAIGERGRQAGGLRLRSAQAVAAGKAAVSPAARLLHAGTMRRPPATLLLRCRTRPAMS